jgi:hypothetical protein
MADRRLILGLLVPVLLGHAVQDEGTRLPVRPEGTNYVGSSVSCADDGTRTTCTFAASAPTTADYLVGTADAGLSAEIVVGTTPGGELGGTWASPTLDDSVTVTGWELGASTATTPAANDNDTSLATTAFVQSEIDDGDFLTDNCPLENDATPIPDSCVGDGVDGGGGGGGLTHPEIMSRLSMGF